MRDLGLDGFRNRLRVGGFDDRPSDDEIIGARGNCAARRHDPLLVTARRTRNVVIEFPDYETAIACYNSPEYQANIKVRQPHSVADLIIIEGYDGPQPSDN